MGRIYRKLLALSLSGLLVGLTLLPGYSQAAAGPQDIRGHWAEALLLAQWQKGLLTGEKVGQSYYLRPDRPLKRAELVVLLLRNQYVTRQQPEKEIALPADSRGHWAAPYLAEAMASGLLRGYPDGGLKPERVLTRAELAALLSRLPGQQIAGTGEQVNFTDIAGHWAASAITALAGAGVLKGYPDGSFQPERAASRAEVAVLLERLWPGQQPPDRDGDGVNDGLEGHYETLELVADSDFDGIKDGEEIRLGLAPKRPDTDGDGLTDQEELLLDTNPLRRDSKGDGRADGERLYEQTLFEPDLPLQPQVTANLPAPASYALALREQPESEALPLQHNQARLGPALEVLAAPGRRGKVVLEAGLALTAASNRGNLLVAHYQPRTNKLEYFPPRFTDSGRILVEGAELAGTWYLVDGSRLARGWPGEGQGARDVLLLLDASGSMSTADREDYRLELAGEIIDRLGRRDRVAVMTFTDETALLTPLTAERQRARQELGRIEADGDTDLQAAVAGALQYLKQAGRGVAEKTIVLFTEGHNTRPEIIWELGEEAAAAGIKIHTLGLGVGVHGVLRDLAEASGGQYQDDWHGEDLLELYPPATTRDSDGDGLTDEEETQGLPTRYGQLFFTDPGRADTDGDGLSDGVEIGAVNISSAYTAQVVESGFSIRSNPLCPDSDNDGLNDRIDARPRLRDWPVLVLLHGLYSDQTIWGIFKDREHIAPDSLLGFLRQCGYDLNQIEPYQYPSTEHVSKVAASLRQSLLQGERKRHPYGDQFAYFLVGHSKGGLVGRYLVEQQLLPRPILGLATIGTPHRGWTLFTGSTKDLDPDSELFSTRPVANRVCQALSGQTGGVPYFPIATEYNSWQDKIVVKAEEVETYKRPGDWVVGNDNALAWGIPARRRYLLKSPEKYYHWESHHNPLVWATIRQELAEIMGID